MDTVVLRHPARVVLHYRCGVLERNSENGTVLFRSVDLYAITFQPVERLDQAVLPL